jgi:hypothetical protein
VCSHDSRVQIRQCVIFSLKRERPPTLSPYADDRSSPLLWVNGANMWEIVMGDRSNIQHTSAILVSLFLSDRA